MGETPELAAELKADALFRRSRAGLYLFFFFNLSTAQMLLGSITGSESSDAVDAEVSTRSDLKAWKKEMLLNIWRSTYYSRWELCDKSDFISCPDGIDLVR